MSITTSYQDLNNIFNHNIRAKDLAEFLVSFDYDQPAKSVKEVVNGKGYTVVGVRKDGGVIGYVITEELKDNSILADYMKEINDEKNSVKKPKDPTKRRFIEEFNWYWKRSKEFRFGIIILFTLFLGLIGLILENI
jgi:hypothetical protein